MRIGSCEDRDEDQVARFVTALSLVKLDAATGFVGSPVELAVLQRLSVAMACHSPTGQRWERLGFVVWAILQHQRGDEDIADLPDLVQEYFVLRSMVLDNVIRAGSVAMPDTPPGPRSEKAVLHHRRWHEPRFVELGPVPDDYADDDWYSSLTEADVPPAPVTPDDA